MASDKHNPKQYRKGAASLYVVIFTTLLLAITSTSFIRIVLRDTIGSGELDSSQAAYDAALAGIESAKIALLKYHRCLTEGLTGTITTGGGTVNCDDVVAVMQNENASTDCNIVQKILGQSYVSGGEIPLATSTIVNEDDLRGEYLDQAISCVLITEEEDDYRGALANSDPPQSKLVPIRTTSTTPITHVRIEWFASNDGANTTNTRGGGINNKPSAGLAGLGENTGMLNGTNYNTSAQVSPLYVQLLQTSTEFNIAEFYLNEGNSTDSAAVLFVPNNGAKTTPVVTRDRFAQSNSKTPNQPVAVGCSTTGNYRCSAIIELPDPIGGVARNSGASFLRLMIPYGNPYTQYSVTLCAAGPDCAPGRIRFAVQSTISSVGRAGDSFRRVEERVEFVDNKAPLPQYALNIGSSIDKNFYVTVNNWGGANYGEAVNMSTAE